MLFGVLHDRLQVFLLEQAREIGLETGVRPAAARQLKRMFDEAMAPDVRSWQLAGDATWTRTGERDNQKELLALRGENAG